MIARRHRQYHRPSRAAPDAAAPFLHAFQIDALDGDANPGAGFGAAHSRQCGRSRPDLSQSRDGESGLAREAAGVLLQRRVEGAEIAEAVAYLAKARSVTGQLIAVDSGQHLGWRTPDIVE